VGIFTTISSNASTDDSKNDGADNDGANGRSRHLSNVHLLASNRQLCGPII